MDVELTPRRNADNDNIEDELNEIDDIDGDDESENQASIRRGPGKNN